MSHRLFALAALAVLFAAAPAAAQTDTLGIATPTQAVSILPLHAALGFYAGDYERAVSPTVTAGIGGAWFSLSDEDADDVLGYSSLEAKVRYYPSADPLNGLSFGLTMGATFLSEESSDFEGGTQEDDITALGVGFEIARSHLMGVDRRFYYAYGAGFKRLFKISGEDDDAQMALPTLRLSVGFAF